MAARSLNHGGKIAARETFITRLQRAVFRATERKGGGL